MILFGEARAQILYKRGQLRSGYKRVEEKWLILRDSATFELYKRRVKNLRKGSTKLEHRGAVKLVVFKLDEAINKIGFRALVEKSTNYLTSEFRTVWGIAFFSIEYALFR